MTPTEGLYAWHGTENGGRGRELMWRRMFELKKCVIGQGYIRDRRISNGIVDLDLIRSSFIPALLRHQPDTFPGSSMLALRLLAFFTSWLRYHFTPVSTRGHLNQPTKNQPCPVEPGAEAEHQLARVVGALEHQGWHPCRRERACTKGRCLLHFLLSVILEICCVRDQIHRLNSQLYQDFSRFPPAEAKLAPQLGCGSEETTVEDEGNCVHDKTQVTCQSTTE